MSPITEKDTLEKWYDGLIGESDQIYRVYTYGGSVRMWDSLVS